MIFELYSYLYIYIYIVWIIYIVHVSESDFWNASNFNGIYQWFPLMHQSLEKSIQTEYSFDTKLNFEPFCGLKYLLYSFT